MADTRLNIERSIGSTGQPITRHPLFPAIVALWFGALAGLGSVVVSSSTIEGLVLALGIDKVVPMAAPPLGSTMRILLALAMTGIGAAIGGLVARRIARPAALPAAAADAVAGNADEQADAAPVARRRRTLAIEPEAAPIAEDHAPLPGDSRSGDSRSGDSTSGDSPDARILNVADFDIDSFDEAPDQPPFRRTEKIAAIDAGVSEPIEENGQEVREDDNLPAWLDAETAWREPASPFATSGRGVFTTPPGAQIFQAELEAAEEAAREDAKAPVGSRLFEAYSRELSPRNDAAEQVMSGEKEAAPGFRLLPRLPQGDWDAPEVDAAEIEAEAPVWTEPAFDAPIAVDVAPGIEDEAFEETAPFAAPAETVPETFVRSRSAVGRIADADLGTLSQVELLERLALAMERRREDARRTAAETAAVIPQASAAPFAAPVLDVTEEPVAPQAFVGAAVPDALRPIALDPIDHTLDDETSATPLSGFQPPRHIGLAMPQQPFGDDKDAAAFDPHAAIPFPSSPFRSEPDVAADDEEEDAVLQQGYASLFNLSRQTAVRKPFLQFGEADEVGDDIAHATPVLSDGERDEPAPFGRPVLLPDPTGEAPAAYEERPFDTPRNDPEATERALRAALATLQRMSGAA